MEKKEQNMLVKQKLKTTAGKTSYKLSKCNFDNKIGFKETINVINVGREFVSE